MDDCLRAGLRARLRRAFGRLRGRRPEQVIPVRLYTRAGCHLCEQLEAHLAAADLGLEYELERVDITLDPELEQRYALQIPVLLVGGRLAFAGPIRGETLEPRFKKLGQRYLRDGPPSG